MPVILASLLAKSICEELIEPNEGILHHEEGADFIPANAELPAMAMSFINIVSRETIPRIR